MNLELKKAIDQISKDKGLDRDMLIKTLEDAVRTSVQRRFSEDMDVEVRYNDNTGDIEVYQSRSWWKTARSKTKTPTSASPKPAPMIPPCRSTTKSVSA